MMELYTLGAINVTFLLAILGISLLIFIHELGHYYAAKKVGMKIEVFSIGLGPPIFSWSAGGVKWQVAYFLLGGYVKIAGMDPEGKEDPHAVQGGFYSQKIRQRLFVVLAGPLANFLFALLAFTLLWLSGGRRDPFSHHTQIIGDLDSNSTLYEQGVRSGDSLLFANGEPLYGLNDWMKVGISKGEVKLQGNSFNWVLGKSSPYSVDVMNKKASLGSPFGILAPACYLIYQEEDTTPINSPIKDSGILPGDRLIWVNGRIIFSDQQLRHVLSAKDAWIQYEREGQRKEGIVPYVSYDREVLTDHQRGELLDLYLEAGQEYPRYGLPILCNSDLKVETSWGEDNLIQSGDRLIGFNGLPIDSLDQLLVLVERRPIRCIVSREGPREVVDWQHADDDFRKSLLNQSWMPLTRVLNRDRVVMGKYELLAPIDPLLRSDLIYSPSAQEEIDRSIDAQYEVILKIQDREERQLMKKAWLDNQRERVLGALFSHVDVKYNPNPFQLFYQVFDEICSNISGLISGRLSAKYFGGPLMVVKIISHSFSIGFPQALFWLASISLNLGLLNLLPLPILDGGHILLTLIEAVRRRALSPLAMRRIMAPSAAILLFFLLYLTYQDIFRVMGW
ncbi:MAG: site-2 protease family protein [Chlamydiota bacterium]|nr:site-2 protease family protein [Chlamydiota bacterium]